MNATLLVSWFLLGTALLPNNGRIGPVSLPLMLASVLLVGLVVQRGHEATRLARFEPGTVCFALLLLAAALVWARPLGEAGYQATAVAAQVCLVGVFAVAAFAFFPHARSTEPPGWRLYLILGLYAAAGVLVLRATPSPHIDVFTIQQEGARDLWAGIDSFGAAFTNPYTRDATVRFFGTPLSRLTHYPYPPLSLVLTSVSWRATGDVRYTLLLAQLASAAGLYALARQHGSDQRIAQALAALFLLHPRGAFVLERAWTEPLLCATLIWGVWALGRPRERRADSLAVVVCLGAFLAVKQYSVLLLPLFAARRHFGGPPVRTLAWSIALALAVTMPFVIWNPRAYFDSVWMFQVRQPFRMGALSIAPVIAMLTGWKPAALNFVAAGVAMAWGWRRGPRGLAGLVLVGAMVVLAFFATAKQAFCNYYYFAGTMVICSALVVPTPGRAAGTDERPLVGKKKRPPIALATSGL